MVGECWTEKDFTVFVMNVSNTRCGVDIQNRRKEKNTYYANGRVGGLTCSPDFPPVLLFTRPGPESSRITHPSVRDIPENPNETFPLNLPRDFWVQVLVRDSVSICGPDATVVNILCRKFASLRRLYTCFGGYFRSYFIFHNIRWLSRARVCILYVLYRTADHKRITSNNFPRYKTERWASGVCIVFAHARLFICRFVFLTFLSGKTPVEMKRASNRNE